MRTFVVVRFGLLAAASLIIVLPGVAQQPPKPYKVTIVGEKENVVAGVTPVDPRILIAYQQQNGRDFSVNLEGKAISSNLSSLFLIDGRIVNPMAGKQLQALPPGPSGKKRFGSQMILEQGGVRIVKTMEVVPGKRTPPKPGVPVVRRMDTLLVRCTMENISTVPHRIGCRGVVESGAIKEPGLRYYSPMHPKQTLLGVILQKKEVPPFLEALERDNLSDPGFKGILTFKFGDKVEMPSKVVLTRIGLVDDGTWDIAADPGVFSVCVFYLDERVLLPQGKREFVYGYGAGLATINEGLVSAQFSGSFDPGRAFTITAYVDGPLDGQSLTLQLPKGMERLDGKATQIVPPESETIGHSVVMWRCRVKEAGAHPISIRSSNGVTQTWTVTVSAPD